MQLKFQILILTTIEYYCNGDKHSRANIFYQPNEMQFNSIVKEVYKKFEFPSNMVGNITINRKCPDVNKCYLWVRN